MIAFEQIADQLQCSELAAGELSKTATALAQCFVSLHDTYDLTHVLDAKRAARNPENVPDARQSTGAVQDRRETERRERARLIRRALSRSANDMFKSVQATVEADDQFRTALSVANCQLSHTPVEALTLVLSAIHSAFQLTSPDKVRDGRLAYESLRRDHTLLQQLGILN